MSTKLDEFEKDPDGFNVDEENVDELINQLGDDAEGEGQPEPTQEDETGSQPTDKEEGKPTGEAEGEESDEKKPESDEEKPKEKAGKDEEEKGAADDEPQSVIKTRDGKHEIPYSVLEETRRQLRETQQQLDELKSKGAVTDKPAEPTDDTSTQQPGDKPAASAEMDDETFERWKEEFGEDIAEQERQRRQELADLRAQQAELQKQLKESEQWREQQERKAKEDESTEINEAIDSIDELREWLKSEDPMWDAAVAMDNRMMADPEYRAKSYRERFETVVEKLTGRAPKQSSSESNEGDDKSIRDKVDQKLADQDKRQTTTPNSLSDVPGGTPPDQSETDTLERLTPSQLESKLANMSQEQMDEYLARL